MTYEIPATKVGTTIYPLVTKTFDHGYGIKTSVQMIDFGSELGRLIGADKVSITSPLLPSRTGTLSALHDTLRVPSYLQPVKLLNYERLG